MYQNDWIPVLGEVLQCSCKVGNAHDPYAVKVMKAGTRAGTMVGPTCRRKQAQPVHCLLGKVERLIAK